MTNTLEGPDPDDMKAGEIYKIVDQDKTKAGDRMLSMEKVHLSSEDGRVWTAKNYAASTLPPESIIPVSDCMSYVTFWLDGWAMERIQALVELEEHHDIYAFLRYEVIKTGLECLLSNHGEIGRKYVEKLMPQKKEAS